jgi:Xaa-Pro dipeptidase
MNTRIQSVRGKIASDGVHLLIAASSGLHTLDRPDPVAWLSGYRSVAESLFLLHRSGDSMLIVSPAADADRLASLYSSSPSLATDYLYDAARDFLEDHRANTIATANLQALPYRLAEQLLALLGPTGNPYDDILYTIDPGKTADEIDRARSATSIAEKGYLKLLEIAQPGMRECDLAVELNCFTKSLGAEDNFLMLSSLPHSRAVMPSSTRPVEPGDILLTELSPNYKGQFSQICRTVSIGAPSPALQEKYELAVRSMWAGIEAIKPGALVLDVCRAIDGVLERAGYAEYCRPPHIRRRGHGLGSGSVFPGDISIDNHTALQENMMFVIHPNQYIPEVGYLLCGEPVRVTATGAEVLTSRTAALGIISINRPEPFKCS